MTRSLHVPHFQKTPIYPISFATAPGCGEYHFVSSFHQMATPIFPTGHAMDGTTWHGLDNRKNRSAHPRPKNQFSMPTAFRSVSEGNRTNRSFLPSLSRKSVMFHLRSMQLWPPNRKNRSGHPLSKNHFPMPTAFRSVSEGNRTNRSFLPAPERESSWA